MITSRHLSIHFKESRWAGSIPVISRSLAMQNSKCTCILCGGHTDADADAVTRCDML